MTRRFTFARLCRGMLTSRLAATLAIVSGAPGAHLAAQDQGSMRLTVRPHSMTLGQRTAQAGGYELNGNHDSVYVPTTSGRHETGTVGRALLPDLERWRAMADKYGMIIVSLSEDV